MITAPDDAMVRTHDDAIALLRYAVPGARVETWQPPRGRDNARSYSVSLERLGAEPIVVHAAYALPCDANSLARHARGQVEKYAPSRA